MLRHGDKLIPAATTALGTISDEDLEARVVAKFTALQKGLRMEGFLDAQNRRIVQPAQDGKNAGGGAGGAGNAGVAGATAAAEAKKKKATLISRAKGVSTAIFSTHCDGRSSEMVI